MSREIQFLESMMVLKLKGSTGFFALKFILKIPYQNIQSVYVDYFDAPQWMLRMPGTSFPPNVYEGSFKYADEWYFLSYEKREPLVIINLDGHEKYKYVIFQVDDPSSVAADIRKHRREHLLR
ncbi:hypothetical protein P9578_24435 [Brevibacillus choshinensis]|uniref:hypothetical protein n=1 Tax=Brevibacillus choshinensis TaxID=54911 RepID=UPI002E1D7497|nr:hypothetical protein [Brevibacillus choshinensis]